MNARERTLRIKRLVDLAVSFSLLTGLSPLLLLLALLVRFNFGGPVLFKQKRPGLHGKEFLIYKFRTMTQDKDANGNLLSDAERLTRFGAWLRSTSLDELPELLNVLKGEMSLVGPRPLLSQYLPLYSSEQLKRHDVLPGITGWAQVNGRNAISWEEKFRHDLEYVNQLSLIMDLKILFLTLLKIIKKEGIQQKGHATTEPFKGTWPEHTPAGHEETQSQVQD